MKYTAIDIETIGLNPFGGTIWMCAVNDGKKIKVLHDCNGGAKFFKELKPMLEDESVCKVIHNAAFDMPYIELCTGIKIRNVWDTRLAEIVIQGIQIPRGSRDEALKKRHSSSLKYTLPRYGFPLLDKDIVQNFINRPKGKAFTKEEIRYAENDVKYLLALQKAQEFILTRDGELETALLENKVVEVVADMRVRGVGFDRNIWLQIAERNELEFNLRMNKLPKEVSNWNSTQQVKKYFMNIGVMIPSYSELDAVYAVTKNDTLGNFIQARSLHKAVTSYGKNWLIEGFVDGDNRVRTEFEQILNTGRFSSSNPNLQQIPSEGYHRAAFVPKKGHVFIIGDFSGQEIGIMAAAAEEDIWIDALLRGDDIHSLTASLMYAPEWEATKERKCKFPAKCECVEHKKLRHQAKILNFMLAYGGGPQKFSESTGLELWEAKVVVKKYKKVVQRLTNWLDKNAKDALSLGVSYSADPYRRRRYLRAEEDWQIANQGKNNPIQSAGANMTKLAMVSLPKEFPVVLTLHDELMLEVPEAKANKALIALRVVMEKSADYVTGIKGLIKVEPRIAINLVKDPCKAKHKISKGFCTICGHKI